MSIEFKHVNYTYGAGTAFETPVLRDLSFKIEHGEFVGLIGHTGSGKSTLIQHMNGLLKADSGEILFHGQNIYADGYKMKDLRPHVGLVFQYPEYQLFESTVLEDVSFGPKNLGLSKEEIRERAEVALAHVGLDQAIFDKSPFDLSGGQKRRVAIAGVLAMRPEFLILDEPASGLDPAGRDEILHTIRRLHDEYEMSVILVSHSMDDVAEYVDRILVINEGSVMIDGTPREVFSRYKELEAIGLAAPSMTYLAQELREKGLDIPADILTIDEAEEAILRLFGKAGEEK